MIDLSEEKEITMENIKELIKEYCDDEGLSYMEDYSGRGMYNRRCVAVTCDNPLYVLSGLFAFLVDWMGEGSIGGDIYYALGEPRQDSMGMSSILYFPKLRTE